MLATVIILDHSEQFARRPVRNMSRPQGNAKILDFGERPNEKLAGFVSRGGESEAILI